MTTTRSARITRPGRIAVARPCTRCGGAGGSDAWTFTGKVCWRCGAMTAMRDFGHGLQFCDPTPEMVYAYPADWTDEQVEANEARRETRRLARAEKKAARQTAERDAWLAGHPEVAALVARVDEFEDGFVADVLRQAARGPLTDRQVEVLLPAAERYLAARAERAGREAAEAAARRPVPTGRVVVEGEVLTTKVQESQFGSTLKMLVKGDGWKVWGSVPRNLCGPPLRGRPVRFTATVEASGDDEAFGFYKRPTGAEFTDDSEETS
jgi:hypothetical protein